MGATDFELDAKSFFDGAERRTEILHVHVGERQQQYEEAQHQRRDVAERSHPCGSPLGRAVAIFFVIHSRRPLGTATRLTPPRRRWAARAEKAAPEVCP